jgi:hypothetical protein
MGGLGVQMGAAPNVLGLAVRLRLACTRHFDKLGLPPTPLGRREAGVNPSVYIGLAARHTKANKPTRDNLG